MRKKENIEGACAHSATHTMDRHKAAVVFLLSGKRCFESPVGDSKRAVKADNYTGKQARSRVRMPVEEVINANRRAISRVARHGANRPLSLSHLP